MSDQFSISNLPVSIVIFGASGDLAHRKLIPALFNLSRKQRLPANYEIFGFAINDWNEAEFRTSLQDGVTRLAEYQFTFEEWLGFSTHLHYIKGNFTDPADYQRMTELLKSVEHGPVNRLYYLATPPQFFGPIVQMLGQAGMTDEKEGWRRVVIEKPFGSNLKSAKALNTTLHGVLKEDQIFRIDHYLGKETVQNLLIFRFANSIFEPIWNNDYIENVQISVLEEVDIGHRAGYYEQAGIVRDMFQNHIMQLLMLIAMDPPSTFRNLDLHDRKKEVLKALQPLTGPNIAKNTVRGQYEGYRQSPDVAPDSQTATYAALRLHINNKRWKGVPFYLRSGKALNRRCTEIIIQFKYPGTAVPPLPPGEQIRPNVLAICIQPDEGIFLRFEAKVPDTEADMRSVEMVFHYDTAFGPTSIPEAYERLILEAIQGDHTLFTQDDTAELTWQYIDPILEYWLAKNEPPLETYPKNSWGPESANQLIAEDGNEWLVTCSHKHDADEHEPQITNQTDTASSTPG